MAKSSWSRLLFLAAPLAHSSTPTVDPNDQSWITKWAALGDSYASGLGVGPRVDYTCSRYNGSYPSLISSDTRFGSNPNRTFQHLACSGATSAQVLAKQVPKLEDGQDVIIVSAGGNDACLGDVLDACVFQFRHGNSAQCEAALARSQKSIDEELAGHVDALVAALTPKLRRDGLGRIYYTGYAQFFGAARSCDNVSWSVWPRMPAADRQNLTLERRLLMNDMVKTVNLKLELAARKAGSHVKFVDWDWTFAQAEGRFCEEGTKAEPAPDREGLLFYEWDTLDDGEDRRLIERPGDPVPSDTFEGDIGKWVLQSLLERPEYTEFGPQGSEYVRLDEQEVVEEVVRQSGLEIAMGFDDFIFWFLPDSWKRVFHPRQMGHHIIANMVLHHMAVERAQMLGIEAPKRPDTKAWLTTELNDGNVEL